MVAVAKTKPDSRRQVQDEAGAGAGGGISMDTLAIVLSLLVGAAGYLVQVCTSLASCAPLNSAPTIGRVLSLIESSLVCPCEFTQYVIIMALILRRSRPGKLSEAQWSSSKSGVSIL